MNCVNHPDTPVAAFCQNCGKALCAQCTRQVGGFVYCEQCLAAKVGTPAGSPPVAGAPFSGPGPNPALATLLGFIPGVGAMYNGQFVKAMIHVLVFVILIAITNEHDFFGFFIMAWILYQVFDANQTAKARRDGLPLPDPFGLNDFASRIGSHGPASGDRHQARWAANPVSEYPPPPSSYPQPPVPPNPSAAPFASGIYPPPPPVGAAYAAPPPQSAPFASSTPFPEPPPPYIEARRSEPAGAIILIAIGLIFLFGTLGIFRFDWIGKGWPLIIIAVGVWLFLKRARETPPAPPAPPPPAAGGSL